MVEKEYDMIVLGAGLAGSISALCLSRVGLRVLVVEKKTHPRFAIGESTTPQSTFDARYLSSKYGIPELGKVSQYLRMRSTGCTTYPKEIFWFGFHHPGEELNLNHEIVTNATNPPLGPDCHMLRADIDEYLTKLFPKYGVDFLDFTAVKKFDNTNTDYVDMMLETYSKDTKSPTVEKETQVRCKYVVDATGHTCYLARMFGLHDEDATLLHRSRTLYSHFEKPANWSLDDVCGGRNEYLYTKRDNGTMHHFFEGGWFWVIPFENDTVSVGLTMDTTVHPLDHSVSAEQEFWNMVNRFPTVKKHLGGLKATRSYVRSGRLQISAQSILGDRFILTPHASTFIDPLYSTGISLTLRFVNRFVPYAKRICELPKGTNPKEITKMLTPIEVNFKKEVDIIDKIVGGAFDATHHVILFRQFWRLWIIAAFEQVVLFKEEKDSPLFAAGNPAFVASIDEAYKLVHDYALKVRATDPTRKNYVKDEADVMRIGSRLKLIADERIEYIHKNILIDLMPSVPVEPIKPLILPGGVCSEYELDFIAGYKRPRVLSFALAAWAIIWMFVVIFVSKIVPYKHGNYLSDVMKCHYNGKKAVHVTPITILNRVIKRKRGIHNTVQI